jgi:hypothetical protein
MAVDDHQCCIEEYAEQDQNYGHKAEISISRLVHMRLRRRFRAPDGPARIRCATDRSNVALHGTLEDPLGARMHHPLEVVAAEPMKGISAAPMARTRGGSTPYVADPVA